MNEHSYIKAIHRYLPNDLYKWKINDNFHGGVADAYYSGEAGDLWIEYKYVAKPPKKPDTVIKTCLSDQQLNWLKSRQSEGRRVALVIGITAFEGYKNHNSVILTDFNHKVTVKSFISSAVDRKDVAEYITNHCLG